MVSMHVAWHADATHLHSENDKEHSFISKNEIKVNVSINYDVKC